MKTYIYTVLIIILTCYRASAFVEKDGRNLAVNELRSSKYFTKEPIGLNSQQPDERVSDSYSRNNGRVRFEDNPPTPLDKPNFFPIDTTHTDNDDKVNTNNDLAETPLYDEEASEENLEDNEDKKIFTKYENTYNKEIVGTTKETDTDNSNFNGRVVFEDDNQKENRESVKIKKRRPRKRPDNKVMDYPNPSYPGYPGPGYDRPHSITHSKRPGYYQHQTGYAGSYGLYSGLQKPPRKVKNPVVNPGHSNSGEDSEVERPYRRPEDQRQEYAGAVYSGYLPQAGFPGSNGYGNVDGQNLQNGQYQYPGHHKYPMPPRRPKSITQQAVSAVAEALTSIALFDDKQCVPRLLCEAASGRTAGSPMLLKATAGIGPLLSILQSYNTASSSPLFVFGRAAVLGVTSVGQTIACHRAYPQCPTDPTELINYLNNHNGGFFRFFGQPKGPKKQQNLEQFYNHLAGQTQQQVQQETHQQAQQHQQNYANTYGYGNQQYPKNNEPFNDDEDSNSKVLDIETSASEIRERILNKPGIDIINAEEEEEGSKWTFPDEADNKRKERKPRRPRKQTITNPNTERLPRGDRIGSILKFPEDRRPIKDRPNIDRERDYIRTQKLIFFQNNNDLDFGNYQSNAVVNPEDYVFDYKHNFYVKRPKQIYNTISNDEAQLVYIVRGNGDPNHPEIVRVKSGQRI